MTAIFPAIKLCFSTYGRSTIPGQRNLPTPAPALHINLINSATEIIERSIYNTYSFSWPISCDGASVPSFNVWATSLQALGADRYRSTKPVPRYFGPHTGTLFEEIILTRYIREHTTFNRTALPLPQSLHSVGTASKILSFIPIVSMRCSRL